MAKRLAHNQVESVLKQLVQKQQGKCAICGHPFSVKDYAVLDHDHDTGFIRGALHNSCNGVEGKLKAKARLCHTGVSSYRYLIRLGQYLEKHSSPQYQLLHPSHKTDDEKRLLRNAKARLRRKTKATK